jgi:hypothetical protein
MSLRRSKAASKSLPPGLAICNNFAVVPLPKHILDHDPTWAELLAPLIVARRAPLLVVWAY